MVSNDIVIVFGIYNTLICKRLFWRCESGVLGWLLVSTIVIRLEVLEDTSSNLSYFNPFTKTLINLLKSRSSPLYVVSVRNQVKLTEI